MVLKRQHVYCHFCALYTCIFIFIILGIITFQSRKVSFRDMTSQAILKFVNITADERKDSFVNSHLYNLHINSYKCEFEKPFLVMVIHSAPHYFSKRALIRSTFGSVSQYRQRNITKVFLVGETENITVQEQLDEESMLYGDVVQGNFMDSYRSLVKKHILGMYWYQHFCSADYVLKLDDDTFVNPYMLIKYITETKPTGLRMWCRVAKRFRPFRDPKSKYHTPRAQYPFGIFPNFCLGFAYLTTPEAWKVMYKASETTRVMNMDDVYVGILSMKAKVQQIDFSKLLFRCLLKKPMQMKYLSKKALFFDPLAECGGLPFQHWKNINAE